MKANHEPIPAYPFSCWRWKAEGDERWRQGQDCAILGHSTDID
jgi:hypothetical protein